MGDVKLFQIVAHCERLDVRQEIMIEAADEDSAQKVAEQMLRDEWDVIDVEPYHEED